MQLILLEGLCFFLHTTAFDLKCAFAYFNGFGQVAIGLLVVILFGALGTTLDPMFGLQLIVGFQGGVGVGTAVGPMAEGLGWSASEAAAVGETCAVAGLVLSVLIGVQWNRYPGLRWIRLSWHR